MVQAIQQATDSVVNTMQHGEAAANANAEKMADVRQRFGVVFDNIQDISACADSIAKSIYNQVDSLLKVTDINKEMNDLNNDILNFSKLNGLSEADLSKLCEHIFQHIANYQLSQSEFSDEPRQTNRNHPDADTDNPVSTGASNDEDSVELF